PLLLSLPVWPRGDGRAQRRDDVLPRARPRLAREEVHRPVEAPATAHEAAHERAVGGGGGEGEGRRDVVHAPPGAQARALPGGRVEPGDEVDEGGPGTGGGRPHLVLGHPVVGCTHGSASRTDTMI